MEIHLGASTREIPQSFERGAQCRWQALGHGGDHALLDIYVLIGREAMSRAFAAVYPLNTRYGEPLSAGARQAFIDAAPPELREIVSARISTVTF